MVAFWMGLVGGWVSMILFICLTGNLRTRAEQEAAADEKVNQNTIA